MVGHRVSVGGLRRAGFGVAGGLLVAACALLVSACGSSAASTTGSSTAATTTGEATTTTGGAAGSASFTAYQSCLKAHGVTFPTGGGGGFFGGGSGGSGAAGGTGTTGTGTTGTTTTGSTAPGGFRRRPRTAAEQKALTACASLRPTGGGGFGAGAGRGFTSNPAFAKFRACLQTHGVQTGSAPSSTSTTSSSAFAACRSLLPQGSFGGGGFGGGGGGAGSSGGAPGTSFQKLQACLRAHGVQPGAAASTPAKTAAALAACRSQLPSGGNGSPAGSSTTTG
jgi:hypothetical protein